MFLCGQSGLLGLEECAAVTRARHQREAGLFVPLQALANEKIPIWTLPRHACPHALCSHYQVVCTTINTSVLFSNPAGLTIVRRQSSGTLAVWNDR